MDTETRDKITPQVGDIIQGSLIGRRESTKFIYTKCVDCQKPRWVRLNVKTNEPRNPRCGSCAVGKFTPRRCREKHHSWRGGRTVTAGGYIQIVIPPNDPLQCMTWNSKWHPNQMPEHRYVMAKHLNRPLKSDEIVHHLNNIKRDNKISNLFLTNEHDHKGVEYRKIYERGFDDGYEQGRGDFI